MKYLSELFIRASDFCIDLVYKLGVLFLRKYVIVRLSCITLEARIGMEDGELRLDGLA